MSPAGSCLPSALLVPCWAFGRCPLCLVSLTLPHTVLCSAASAPRLPGQGWLLPLWGLCRTCHLSWEGSS